MIELAPDHKLGLPVDSPVLLAAGAIGYGESRHRELTLERFGAVVIGPFTNRSRAGSQPPRMAQTLGGFVRRVELQNQGRISRGTEVRRPLAPARLSGDCPDRGQ